MNSHTPASFPVSQSACMVSTQLDTILLCIPTYNEANNIKTLLEQIFILYPTLHILIIDDSSQDDTRAIIADMQTHHKTLHMLLRPGKLGLGSAYIDAFRWGLKRGFCYFIQMDADFSHHPRYLAQTISNLPNFDVVINSRNILGGGVVGWGLFRRLLSSFGSFYARMCLGVRIMDFTGGFNAYSKNALLSLGLDNITSNGYCFQIEMKYKASLASARIVELPIIFEDRVQGSSKMSKSIIIEALWRTPFLRLSRYFRQTHKTTPYINKH